MTVGARHLAAAPALSATLARFRLLELSRYFVASGVALAIDLGLLIGLTELVHLHYQTAAAIGFSTGLVAIYLMSIFWVFENRALAGNQTAEFVVFTLIGIVGLGINHGVLWLLADAAGAHYLAAKMVSVGIVFAWNFVARKMTLFQRTKVMGTAPVAEAHR